MSPARAPAEPVGPDEVNALLAAWSAGDPAALERLLPVVYDELKAIARRLFRRERGDHTLQPTAVAHEAYLRLAGRAGATVHDRTHFLAMASRVMRQVLVDHARAHAAEKRGAGATRMVLDEELSAGDTAALADVLAVDEALARLAALDDAQARLVELRFFGGLTIEETAAVLGVSAPTVKRDWRLARAFLNRELVR
jgi:RNA polymerase sigma factor (TIGR02999 family)